MHKVGNMAMHCKLPVHHGKEMLKLSGFSWTKVQMWMHKVGDMAMHCICKLHHGEIVLKLSRFSWIMEHRVGNLKQKAKCGRRYGASCINPKSFRNFHT